MNYYRVQSYYFLIFITIGALAFSALPSLYRATSDFSDSYLKSQLGVVQGEMIFYQQHYGSFKNVCYFGKIGIVLKEVINEYGKTVTCTTNSPEYSKLMVCSELHSGNHYCVDSNLVTCENSTLPERVLSCKELSQIY